MDTYLDDVDKDFAKMRMETDIDEANSELQKTTEARAEIKAARESDNNTIEELSKSKNNYIKEFVGKVKSAYVEEKSNTFDYENMDEGSMLPTIISEVAVNHESFIEKLYGKNSEEAKLGTMPLVAKLKEDMKKKDFRAKAVKALPNDKKSKIYDNLVSKEAKADYEKKGLLSSVNEKMDSSDNVSNQFIDKTKKVGKKLAGKSGERISGKVDLSKKPTSGYPTIKEFLGSMVPGLKSKNTKLMEGLNKYDNKSLREAKDKATPEQVRLIDKVLEKRKEAVSRGGINSTDTKSEKYKYFNERYNVKDDKSDVIKTVKALAGRTEMKDEQEVKNVLNFIDTARERDYLNDAQVKILKARMKKISAKTLKNKISEEQSSRKTLDAAKKDALSKSNDKSFDPSKETSSKYTFKDEKGNTYTGDITFEDKNQGQLVVDFVNADGKQDQVVFGQKRGYQIQQEGKKTIYSGGQRQVKEDNAKKTKQVPTDKYTFETPDGMVHEGTIVAEQDGNYIVEATNPDGNKATFAFNTKTGEHFHPSGKGFLLNGKRVNEEVEIEETTSEDPLESVQFPEQEQGRTDSEETATAAEKANQEILGDFDIEDLNDKELQEMSDTLNTIFDC